MLEIKLPDGKIIQFKNSINGLNLAKKISKSLAKEAYVVSVNGELKDLSYEIKSNSSVKIITSKDKEGLEILRHDTAHILAMAVQELFSGTQVTIGPVIEDGFYYDFSRKEPFIKDDLKKIENKMKEIVDRNEKTTREVWKRNEAIEHFKKIGEHYKSEIIKDIPKEEEVSIYRHGKWHDLCRGPHLSSTGQIGKAFKLTKISGAYWRGDSNNEMLQRIYGTCWASQKDLDNYLKRLEEAEKRDHRKLGKEMDFFHFREESPGSVFWHTKGWNLFLKLIEYMRAKQKEDGYQEINTPELLDRSLWEKSGHWEKFGEHMYTSTTPDEKVFAIKPMNCPGCVQIFNQGLKSYRDLPLKMSEFGKVHRYEPSGALHGLLRVRAFTQDDAHIFCTEEQITQQCLSVTNLILAIYRNLGFKNVILKFSDRPKVRVGEDKIWDKSETALLEAIKASKLEYSICSGEGAFYGPKIDFILRDAAEVLGLKYKNKMCGSFGDISIFSFYANKQVTTGEGGMLSMNSLQIYEKCKSLRNLCFGKLNKFNHDDLGWNYRMTNIQAALGLSQLKNIKHIVNKKMEIGSYYYKKLYKNSNIQILPPSRKFSKNIYWVVGIVIKKDKITASMFAKRLEKYGIKTRPFFWPMHEQKIFRKMKIFKNKKFPNSSYLARQGIYLPSYFNLKKKDIDYISSVINKILK